MSVQIIQLLRLHGELRALAYSGPSIWCRNVPATFKPFNLKLMLQVWDYSQLVSGDKKAALERRIEDKLFLVWNELSMESLKRSSKKRSRSLKRVSGPRSHDPRSPDLWAQAVALVASTQQEVHERLVVSIRNMVRASVTDHEALLARDPKGIAAEIRRQRQEATMRQLEEAMRERARCVRAHGVVGTPVCSTQACVIMC